MSLKISNFEDFKFKISNILTHKFLFLNRKKGIIQSYRDELSKSALEEKFPHKMVMEINLLPPKNSFY